MRKIITIGASYGLIALLLFVVWRSGELIGVIWSNNQQVGANVGFENKNCRAAMESDVPIQVEFSSLDLILPVEVGEYDKNDESWNVSNTAVHFAEFSASPRADCGTTVLYGHNSKNILGKTKELQVGDRLDLLLSDGDKLRYEYVNSYLVEPANTGVFDASGDYSLVLITCDGPLDRQRRLMRFELVESAITVVE